MCYRFCAFKFVGIRKQINQLRHCSVKTSHHESSSKKNSRCATHDAKNELLGLGLDPRIVVKTGENWLSFALGSSQFLKFLQGNFQNLTFTMVLLHNLVKKRYPPSKKNYFELQWDDPNWQIKKNFLKTNYPTHLISPIYKKLLITPK